MTAAVFSRERTVRSGIRPVNPRRDMTAIAALIEEGFSENLDSAGRRMIRSMKSLGRMGWIGWMIAHLTLPPAAYPKGFVWEEDGDVVGNASLMSVVGFPHRWVMANVVVKPAFRGRGIGGELVDKSIGMVKSRLGRKVVLQVDEGNRVARTMYLERGFSPMSIRTTWTLKGMYRVPKSEVMNSPYVRKSTSGEWNERWELANRLHPEGLVWPFPLVKSLFKTRGWTDRAGLKSSMDWIWKEEDRMVGSISARWNFELNRWHLFLMVEPSARGDVELPLLDACLREISGRSAQVVLECESGSGDESIRELGFQSRRTLMWMSLEIDPAQTTP